MHPRFIRLVIVLVFSSLLATGCWDRVEVNDLAVVVATTIDLEEDGHYRVGVQVPLVAQLGGGPGGGEGSAFYVESEKGRTIREAINQLQKRMSRQLVFSHRRILVISEEVAKKGIHDFFDELARLPDNRLTTYMIISKKRAIDLIQATPQFESFSAENMREIVKLPFVIHNNLKDVAASMNRKGTDPIAPYLNVVDEKTKEIEFLGYAQFKWDKMVGVYKEDAAYGISWFQSDFIRHTTTFSAGEKVGDGPITIELFEANKRITPRIKNGKLHYDMKITARGAVQESMISADLRFLKNQEKLNERFGQQIKKHVEEFIDQAKKEKTDSGHWGRMLARRYPKEWYETYSKDWDKWMSEITFDIEVDAKIDRLGQVTENITREKRLP